MHRPGRFATAKWIQFIFTFAKIAAMAALIIFGFLLFKDSSIWHYNWQQPWFAMSISKEAETITHESLSTGALIIAMCSCHGGRPVLQRCMEQRNIYSR